MTVDTVMTATELRARVETKRCADTAACMPAMATRFAALTEVMVEARTTLAGVTWDLSLPEQRALAELALSRGYRVSMHMMGGATGASRACKILIDASLPR